MKSMQKGFTLIELMIVVAIIAILAAIAIPQYQAYVIRSQVTRVIGELGDQKVVVEDCLNNGAFGVTVTSVPGKIAADPSCVMTASSSDLIATGYPTITLDAAGANPSAAITATFGGHANAVLQGAVTTVTWTRNGSGAWTCATTAAAQYAPASCPNG
jgi:type IV pilus assembly protein PilA